MDYSKLFNTYYQIEANNLKGLQPGFVVAQMPVTDSMKETFPTKHEGMMCNGYLCTISKAGIVPAEAGKPVFIHYTEPINTILDGAKYFAVDVESEYPRLVQLIPGDEWMTDMPYDAEVLEALGIVEIKSTDSKDDWYSVSTLADGTEASHYMYIGTTASVGGNE